MTIHVENLGKVIFEKGIGSIDSLVWKKKKTWMLYAGVSWDREEIHGMIEKLKFILTA